MTSYILSHSIAFIDHKTCDWLEHWNIFYKYIPYSDKRLVTQKTLNLSIMQENDIGKCAIKLYQCLTKNLM